MSMLQQFKLVSLLLMSR